MLASFIFILNLWKLIWSIFWFESYLCNVRVFKTDKTDFQICLCNYIQQPLIYQPAPLSSLIRIIDLKGICYLLEITIINFE